jgi:hypothetical protein
MNANWAWRCVDIGAGTTDVAIFTDGAIRHTAVIPIAGDLITSDIAMAFACPPKMLKTSRWKSGFAEAIVGRPRGAGGSARSRRPRTAHALQGKPWRV